jgi:predicted DNA binding protein
VYAEMVEAGGIIQRCTATAEGWELQVRFPDNEALAHFHDACTHHDLDFDLLRKYQQAGGNDPSEGFGLTVKQRELLVHAVQEGYYEVPRDTDLGVVSETMGISHQAGSERLRRAVSLLVRNALSLPLAPDDVTKPKR